MTEINLALFILRFALGATIFAHGYAKFFKGGRIPGTAGWFDSIGMRPGRIHAVLAAGSEVGVGILLMLGLLNTFAAAGLIGLMTVAFYTVHKDRGFLILNEGWEYVFILAVMALVSAMLGPGEWSVDEALGIWDELDGWTGFWIALILGVGSGVALLAVFFRPPKPQTD